MKNRAAALYRSVLRSTRTQWTDPKHVEWVKKTAREEFDSNRNLRDPEEIKRKITEGEQWYETALYYKLPFQRPEHLKHI